MAGNSEKDAKLLRGLTLFQALYRGFRTRKALRETRGELRAIIEEIEGDEFCKYSLEWQSNFSQPIVIERSELDLKQEGSNKKAQPFDKTLLFDSFDTIAENEHMAPLLSTHPRKPEVENIIVLDDDIQKAIGDAIDLSTQTRNEKIHVKANSKTATETCKYPLEVSGLEICLEELKSMSRTEVVQRKKEYEMELMWVNQAIESRKQYIRFKSLKLKTLLPPSTEIATKIEMQKDYKHALQSWLLFRKVLLALSLVLSITSSRIECNDHEEDSEIIYPVFKYTKNKRSQDEADSETTGEFTIHFHAFHKNFNASVKPVNSFLAPKAVWGVIGSNSNTLDNEHVIGEFYKGTLTDDARSHVSLSKSDGMDGVILTNEDQYLIKPLGRNNHQNAHVIVRRILPKATYQYHKEQLRVSAQGDHRARQKRSSRETSTEKTIETLLVVDQKMTQHYGLDGARQYALTVANNAHDILRDASIGPHPVNLVIVKILVLVAPQENLNINHHAHNTLASFGEWAWQLSKSLKAKGENFDYALLFTRYDICKDKEQPCDYNGASYIGGMCNFPTSTAVIQDFGLITGFSIAHHIGHSLGMEHDRLGTSCYAENRVMKPNAGYGEGAFLWSSCSVQKFQEFLRTDRSRCLDDVPPKTKQDNPAPLRNSGNVYDVVSQCELFGGKGSKGCYYGDKDEVCVELQCILQNATSCARTGKPPADGTKCGAGKWCKHGRCIEQHTTDFSIVDGGWSSWGEFKSCSRPCGGGVAYRERICRSPAPLRGGKYCEGDSKGYTICNNKPCPDSIMNFRKQQCKKQSGSFWGDILYNWTYLKTSGKKGTSMESSCMLECVAEKDSKVTKNFGRSVDGTDCFLYDMNLLGKCIAGKCVSVGCDMKLGSREKVDRCGVCEGDGGSCRDEFEPEFHHAPTVFLNVTDRKSNVTEGLSGSLNITVKVNSTIQPNITASGAINGTNGNNTKVETKGINAAKFDNTTGTDHLLNTLRKLKVLRNLMKAVLQKRCNQNRKCLARYKYFDLRRKKSEISRGRTFEWVTVSTGCSVTCGIGTKSLLSECRRVDDGSPVGRKFCSLLPEPVSRVRACKMPSCIARWAVSDWGSCTKTCGAGIQAREVFCIKTINEDFFVPDSLCNSARKPVARRICNKRTCPPIWVTEPFGKCSTSCGRGVQLREVFCKSYVQGTGLAIVPDSRCDAAERPQRDLLCNVHNPCPGQDNCGGNYTQPSGNISSPNYPSQYSNNKECLTQVTVDRDKVISLLFNEFKLNGTRKSARACEGDFLRIIDGHCSATNGKPYSLYCGNEVPVDSITSTSNVICIKFFSDDVGTSKGFLIQYSAVEPPRTDLKVIDVCDAHANAIKSSFGALTSPNYPMAYPANEYCKVTISALGEKGFVIAFKGFNVGTTGNDNQCEDDFLEFYHDGIFEKVCGRHEKKEAKIKSESFTIVFRSGNVNIGGTGFVITFITQKALRLQLAEIQKRKKELANKHLPVKAMSLPVITDALPARFKSDKEKKTMLVEALTNLKKSDISKKAQDQSADVIPARHINNNTTLKRVLDLLGGAILKDETKKEKIPQSINSGQRKSGENVEDYTRSGIYKKNGVPRGYPQSLNFGNGRNLIASELPSWAYDINRPHGQFVYSNNWNLNSNRRTENSVLWNEYWNLLAQRQLKERSYIVKMNSGCPRPDFVSCAAAMKSERCDVERICKYNKGKQCCPSSCPYAQFVCM